MRKFLAKLWGDDSIIFTPKNLRLWTILVGVYQVIASHIVLFLILLGLVHAEEMNALLKVDIADQHEREDYVMNDQSWNNEIKFKSATELASMTLILLYVASGIAGIYLISSLGLLIGTLRNRVNFLIPWLILDLVGIMLTIALMILLSCGLYEFVGGQMQYWLICGSILCLDIFIWFVVHSYFLTLCQMKKLNESATIAIPCPPPECIPKIPYYYRHPRDTNLDGGENYKHLLTETREQYNYIV